MNQNLLSNAITSYACGKIEEAEVLFRQILKDMPYHPQALYFMGLIALDKGILDEACQLLYKATLADRKNKDFQYSLAVALQENGKIDEAILIYEKITDMPEVQNNLGNIYRMKGELEKARIAFDKAIELNPNMAWAYVNKAILERQENRMKETKKLLLKALEIDPNFIQALYQLSILNRNNKNFDSALQYIEKAINLNKNLDFLWVEYGKVFLSLDKNQDALNSFERAIKINRFCADAYFEKAQILEDENPNLAEKAYRDLLRIDTQNIAAFNNLGTLLYRQNRIVEALEMYRNVFIIKPDDTYSAFNLAIALENLEDYEEAAGLYFKVLGQNQLQQEIHIRLANMLPKWFEKDKEKALNYADGWLKNFPDNPLAVHTQKALNGVNSSDDIDFSYSQIFYNAFADSYDKKMQLLNCQIPNVVYQKIKNQKFESTLDLGCGTGACSAFLKQHSNILIGVDVSEKMIKLAHKKSAYKELYTQDITDFLLKNERKFDLIVAADVFCYINQLNIIFENVKNSLSSKGLFIFTVEKNTDKNKVSIQYNGRYQHGLNLIINLLNKIGFSNVEYEEIVLRQENGSNCTGYIFSAQK